MTKWKVAFFLLLGSVAALFAILFILIFLPSGAEKPAMVEVEGETAFHVTSSKAELNQLVNYYLAKEAGSAPIDYDVYIGNDVELYGSFPVFGTDIDYYMTFEPEAMENGDIVLRQKGLRVGLLDIPASYVLKTADSAYAFPDWVHVVPDEERIYVSLAEMRLDNGMRVKAESFNLAKDDIQFAVLLPEGAAQ
ncbi:YpmS family protein [Domibacillus robiginosus]|uniref:YpmS family protein n=1 Tax=Domibacillus robiginosus TaxID=1071054 RepID=UPI00067B450B|nr:YpmS family protein [Domibacillus robiginosus]